MIPQAQTAPPLDNTALVAALLSGGDGRIALDPQTRRNGYLTPPDPAPHLLCASSCTGSPIASASFQRAAAVFNDIEGASSAGQRRALVAEHGLAIEAWLPGYFGVSDLAYAIICPSGTDALLTTALLLAAESPGTAMTAILPVRSETGTGVPLAAACRRLEPGAATGALWSDYDVATVEIPLRRADAEPLSDDEVTAAFKAAAAAAPGRAITYLTYSSKTGLIAPAEPPPGADVVVDACQARIAPTLVAHFLKRGWPVVVTGSKFFGGPAFSGAVLFPKARAGACRPALQSTNLGAVLRWTGAREAMETFATCTNAAATFVRHRVAAIERHIAGSPMLVPVTGLLRQGAHWSDGPSIVTFAVRAHGGCNGMLSTAELRPIYARVAEAGVLLGQPVDLGQFGGLRIAIGARDLLAVDPERGLSRLFAAVQAAIQPGVTKAAHPNSLWPTVLPPQRPPIRVG